QRLAPHGRELGVEVHGVALVREGGAEVRGPVLEAVARGELGELLRVAPHEQRLELDARAVGQEDPALLADREHRADQVLAVSHASGDAVHDDAEGLHPNLLVESAYRKIGREGRRAQGARGRGVRGASLDAQDRAGVVSRTMTSPRTRRTRVPSASSRSIVIAIRPT